ncbi:MAG TPA: nucleotidyltransferase family protein [Anaerolineales bacterium]|nr:nucleotidyltransferase family protein [Anaerolineales bacterium]
MDTRFISLRSKVEPVLRPYARRISVFGSYARGEATPESDVDLLVALKPSEKRPPLGLFEVIRLEKELEKRLGCEVDLVTEDGLNPRIRSNVEKDRVVLYEEV